ncbi:hypothetical protein FACS1894158_05040 [Betaproteobacteria bacterium]|nr:hypothetical protein FACS1894158_05040 [Betaproteobacteria bacterium]
MNASAADSLHDKWQAVWPEALAIWSRFTRLQPAMLCATRKAAQDEGLEGSFAMIRFVDQRIVIDLPTVAELGLEDYALEVLAHEIGHHVLAPANATDNLRLLARMRQALPTLTRHAPMLANLYTDLLINDRLQRQSGLRLADIYRKLAERSGNSGKEKDPPPGGVWALYMRIYEQLWQLDKGSLGETKLDARGETDAWLGARLIRVYARDWLEGSGRFAALMLPYILDDDEAYQRQLRWLHDTASAGRDCVTGGIGEIEAGELEGAIHPAEDPLITGEDGLRPDEPDAPPSPTAPPADKKAGQAREPFEYGEILRAAGVQLSDHDIAIRYYQERALPHLIPYPRKKAPSGMEPLLEGLEAWECGEPLDELDWLQSVLQSPRVIPGVSTVKRLYGEQPGEIPIFDPIDLDIYVDSSGSMPDPRQETSWLTLAGAIIALSALRAGAKVQVTLWSGKNDVVQTPGFIRHPQQILAVLTDFFGRGTAFPIHCLRDAYPQPGGRDRPTHILMISDDGIDTLFGQDEKGNSGWDVAAQALQRAGAGGTLALNLPAHISTYYADSIATIEKAVLTQGWALHRITDWEQLMAFAHDFSRRYRDGRLHATPSFQGPIK